ncbi:hypothetical protein A2U01_0099888, partial [Trifolium medium]|nr:hypothetical protein [Trifolium medium]
PCMGEGVGHLCVGMKLEKVKSWTGDCTRDNGKDSDDP